jgi:hypothetical protein
MLGIFILNVKSTLGCQQAAGQPASQPASQPARPSGSLFVFLDILFFIFRF